jgi:hypothetical protein
VTAMRNQIGFEEDLADFKHLAVGAHEARPTG